MTGYQSLIARAALGVAAAAASIGLVFSARLYSLPQRTFDRFVTVAFFVSRLAVYFGVFFIFHIPPRGDIPSFYWDQALYVLQGLLPYRDFPSSYAPLHAFLDAAIMRVWFSPLAIILFSLLAECLLVPLWLYLGRKLFSDRDLRTAALLYLTSAISIQFVAIDGQDNVILAGLFALAILLLLQDRPVLSGVAVGLGAVVTKFLPLVYAPLFFPGALRRWRWVVGLILPVAAVYGLFVLKHLDVLSVVTNEGGLKSANNFSYLVESLFGITVPSPFWDGLMALVLLAIFVIVARVSRRAPLTLRLHAIVFGTAAVTLTLLLFAKKSWPPYLVLALFPICLLVSAGSRIKVTVFALFGIVAVLAPSYWATILSQFSAQELHEGLLAGRANCYIFFVLQLLLVAGYGWLFAASIRRIISPTQQDTRPERLAN